MRQESSLDPLCTYHVEPADPKRLVPHPQRQELDRQIRAAQTAAGQLVGRRGSLTPGATSDSLVFTPSFGGPLWVGLDC